ncbi:hypothetical protein ACPPVV_12780 [Rhodanobacter sp. Col0626]|uniref:hypothetical protein n=1 Tax=Rhodanobacter sp. Col0626 TaxID=3415679 RepID=UPI003CE9BE05
MKHFLPLVFFGMLAVGSGVAVASSGSLNEFKPRVMPVLLQVNAQGRITDASPSTELSPQLNRLLMQNLAEMISKPATDRRGRPMSSQFIINVALQASPRPEGDYDARFAYVSSNPVPSGSWYWVHIDGHRLALANRNSFDRRQHFRYNENRGSYRPANFRSFQSAPTRSIQNASRNAPSAAPGKGH